MKTFKTFVTLSFLSLLAARPAMASSITLTDLFDPADVFVFGNSADACTGTNGVTDTSLTPCNSLTYTHVLAGFNAATDTLTSGSLVLTLYNGETDGPEKFNLVLDLLTFGFNTPSQLVLDTSTAGSPYTPSYDVLTQLVDGALVVTLTSQNGNHDFYFDQSVLTASGTRDDREDRGGDLAAVPEPGSMLLLGTGLAGLGLGWRSRRKAA